MAGQTKMDINRLVKDELSYELAIRGLGDGEVLTVVDMRAILRSALSLERTALAMKNPRYPFKWAEDVTALDASVDNIRALIADFSGVVNDSKYRTITTKILHSIGRVNNSSPSSAEEIAKKTDIRQALLLAVDQLQEKAKRERRQESTVFDLSVLRKTVGQPEAHSSATDLVVSSDDEQVVVKSKPVPVRDWNLKFTGKPGEISFITFIEQVEERRKSRGVTKAMLFTDAVDFFSDDAYTWYKLVKNFAVDWDSLVELMKEQFLPENFDRDLFEDIKKRTQGVNESIGLYVASMIGLFGKMRTPVADMTQLEIILERIDPYYHPFLAFAEINSVTQLLVFCRKLDFKRGLAKSYVPPPSKRKSLIPELAYASGTSSVASTSSRSSLLEVDKAGTDTRTANFKCFNCDKAGHIARNCSEARAKHCFKCGKKGFTVKTCPDCKRPENYSGRR